MQMRLTVLILALLALALSAGALLSSGRGSPDAAFPDDPAVSELPDNRDTQLYREVIQRVQAGERYYEAASELHRERSYPLYPFFTIRPPTLAHISAGLGSTGLYVAAWGLLALAIVVWLRALAGHPALTRGLAVGLLALGGASLITPAGIVLHEFWCGLLLTIALGFVRDRDWGWRLAFAALALTIREFALLFVLAIGFLALLRRRWIESAAVAGIIVAFGTFMTLHYLAVADVRLPSDLRSPAWSGLRGPAALVADLARLSWLGLLPRPIAALLAFLPLVGWGCAPRPWLALLWFIGFGATIAIFARPNNEYWILALLPAYLMGFALLGRAFSRLANGPSVHSDRNHRSFDSIQ